MESSGYPIAAAGRKGSSIPEGKGIVRREAQKTSPGDEKEEDAGREEAGRNQAVVSPVQTGENWEGGVPCKEEVGRESCGRDGRGTGRDGSGGKRIASKNEGDRCRQCCSDGVVRA